MSLQALGRSPGGSDRRAGGLRRGLRGRDGAEGGGGHEGRRCPAAAEPALHAGEEADDPAFAKALAANGDLFVNDAFSAAHRAHASTDAIARLLPSYAGEAMRRELEALDAALGAPKHPVLGVVGGSKVSTKLDLLHNLVLSWTPWPSAAAWPTPSSSPRAGRWARPIAKRSWPTPRAASWPSPRNTTASSCCPSTSWSQSGPRRGRPPGCGRWARSTTTSASSTPGRRPWRASPPPWTRPATLIWNGPLGVFETPPFDAGTTAAARHAAALAKAGKLIAVAGGGDTGGGPASRRSRR